MSSASDPLPSGYSILGGIPLANPDHVASIIFVVVFFIPLILTILRFVRPRTRTKALLRPVIFDVVRILTYILRYKQASGDYSTGLFIATQILFSLGLLFVGEPLLALLGEAASSGVSKGSGGRSGLLRLFGTKQIRIMIVAAVAIGIYGGTQIEQAIKDPSKMSTIRTTRYVNSGLSIGACAAIVFNAVLNGLPAGPLTFVATVAGMELINSVYKLIIILHSPNPISIGTKVGFYILFSAPEYIAALMFPVFNLRLLFGLDEINPPDTYLMQA